MLNNIEIYGNKIINNNNTCLINIRTGTQKSESIQRILDDSCKEWQKQ